MKSCIALLAFILLLAKIIKLEDVAEKSELLAINLVLGIIGCRSQSKTFNTYSLVCSL